MHTQIYEAPVYDASCHVRTSMHPASIRAPPTFPLAFCPQHRFSLFLKTKRTREQGEKHTSTQLKNILFSTLQFFISNVSNYMTQSQPQCLWSHKITLLKSQRFFFCRTLLHSIKQQNTLKTPNDLLISNFPFVFLTIGSTLEIQLFGLFNITMQYHLTCHFLFFSLSILSHPTIKQVFFPRLYPQHFFFIFPFSLQQR